MLLARNAAFEQFRRSCADKLIEHHKSTRACFLIHADYHTLKMQILMQTQVRVRHTARHTRQAIPAMLCVSLSECSFSFRRYRKNEAIEEHKKVLKAKYEEAKRLGVAACCVLGWHVSLTPTSHYQGKIVDRSQVAPILSIVAHHVTSSCARRRIGKCFSCFYQFTEDKDRSRPT